MNNATLPARTSCKIENLFTSKDLPCAVILTPLGHRCGYVGVPFIEGLAQGDYYDDPILDDISVHGGVTYAERETDEHGQVWVVYGFDCAHAGDTPELWTNNDVYMEVCCFAWQLREKLGDAYQPTNPPPPLF